MSPSQVPQPQPSGKFNLFPCLPFELQAMVFESALADLDQPRVVKLDIETVPAFAPTRYRQAMLGWQLKVENHEELQKESPHELARTLLQTCDTGKYVAKRFIQSHPVWDPPRHCKQLLSHDISLSEDIFWLPDDLFSIDWNMGFARSGRDDWKDEERISCLMVSVGALEEVTRWAMGYFKDQDYQDEANGYVSLDELRLTLNRVLARFPSCHEIIVVDGTPSGERKHISWSDLNYIGPNDEGMCSKVDQYATDCDEADRCMDLIQMYYDLQDSARQNGPQLSFAFKKDCKPRSPPAPIPASAGIAPGKRSRDDEDNEELPASKRQKL